MQLNLFKHIFYPSTGYTIPISKWGSKSNSSLSGCPKHNLLQHLEVEMSNIVQNRYA